MVTKKKKASSKKAAAKPAKKAARKPAKKPAKKAPKKPAKKAAKKAAKKVAAPPKKKGRLELIHGGIESMLSALVGFEDLVRHPQNQAFYRGIRERLTKHRDQVKTAMVAGDG